MNKQVRKFIEQAKLILGLRKKTVAEALLPLQAIVADLEEAKRAADMAALAAVEAAAAAKEEEARQVLFMKRATRSIKELSKAL